MFHALTRTGVRAFESRAYSARTNESIFRNKGMFHGRQVKALTLATPENQRGLTRLINTLKHAEVPDRVNLLFLNERIDGMCPLETAQVLQKRLGTECCPVVRVNRMRADDVSDFYTKAFHCFAPALVLHGGVHPASRESDYYLTTTEALEAMQWRRIGSDDERIRLGCLAAIPLSEGRQERAACIEWTAQLLETDPDFMLIDGEIAEQVKYFASIAERAGRMPHLLPVIARAVDIRTTEESPPILHVNQNSISFIHEARGVGLPVGGYIVNAERALDLNTVLTEIEKFHIH